MKAAIFLCLIAALAAVSQADFPETPLQAGMRRRPKVVGGQEATPHSIPYQLAITQNGIFCGASLISKRFILTAAHCGVVMSAPSVIMGAHKVLEQESGQVIIKGKKTTVHERFNGFSLENDIAVIELSQEAPVNEIIKTIKLPSENAGSFEGVTAQVSGWGLAYDNATSISPVLRVTNSTIMKNKDCDEKFGIGISVKDSMICLDGSEKRSACNGDSGGPLTTNSAQGLVQIGVVSFGSSRGCEKGYPSAYSRITSFLDWIKKNTDYQA